MIAAPVAVTECGKNNVAASVWQQQCTTMSVNGSSSVVVTMGVSVRVSDSVWTLMWM